MRNFNVHEAKTNFSALLSLISMGEEIIISKAGTPVAILSPYRKAKKGQGRKPGLFANKMSVADDFCDPMDAEFLKHFF